MEKEREVPFHAIPIEEVFAKMQTSPTGLSEREVEKRQKAFGKNVLHEEKTSGWKILARQFHNILIYILFGASLVSLFMEEWTDFFVINIILLINGLVGFWQELKAEASIAALKKMTESTERVIRGGKHETVPSSELVPGDFVVLHEGEMVTADIRLTESSGLMIDESAMTGESAPVVKDHSTILPEETLPFELSNLLLAGTSVVRGSGHGIVVRTGGKTYLASIAEKAQEASPETPLGKALRFFSGRYVFLIVVVFFFLGVIGYFQGRALSDLGYILIAGIVAAVPEGLPIVVTLVMVLGALALSKRQTLIRYLPSVETLGSVTVIASDKTGTITEGKLLVKEVVTQEEPLLKKIAALCNDSHGSVGDPLDVALFHWVGSEFPSLRESHPRIWAHSFDARLMLMATAHKEGDSETLFIKGAFEALKERVEDQKTVLEWEKVLSSLLSKGLRVIAFGAGKWEKNPDPNSWKIRLIGLIGFLDPAKKGVEEAVHFAKKAGVHVMMITGDHPTTAKAIGMDVGIATQEEEVLTGKEIASFSDEKLQTHLQKTNILARILPEHKQRIVKLLQKRGDIVAVTGDGVNDVPALKGADIGIAMGSGTEAAKGVAKMVITDNNLKVIVEAIRNARVIADNIRKVIYYLVCTSITEVFLIVLAILADLPLPLAAIQILWINLVTDGVQDKFFPFAKEEGSVMNRKPRRPEKQFFDASQMVRVLVFGLVMGLASFALYFHLISFYSEIVVTTIIFNVVVVSQWANGIQAQKETEPFFKNWKRSFTTNPWIFIGVAIGILLQCGVIYAVPSLFHSVPMTLEHWKYPLFAFFFGFFLVEARKWGEGIWRKNQE